MTVMENGLARMAAATAIGAGEEARHYAQAMEKLVGVIQRLSLARDTDTVTAIVRRAARNLTGADGATFVLRDNGKCYYADEDAIAPLWKGQRFDMSACISGWVMLNRQAAVIEDIYADPRIPVEAYRPTFVKSLVMVPVRSEAPIAAIGNYWATRRQPAAAEVAILQALADTTSVALENIELYQQLQGQLHLLASQQERIREQCSMLELFTRTMAHDLREPMRSILSYSRIIEEEVPLSGEAAQYFGYVRAGAERMALLIDGVYRYTALETPDPPELTACGMASSLEQVRETLSPLIAKSDATLTIEGAANMLVHPEHMAQLWAALIRNAIIHNRGAVDIFAGVRRQEERTVFFVRDNGTGIAEEDRDRIFVPFRRATHRADCAGLGLALCRKIVSLYGGEIWHEPTEAGGATFYFTLPDAEIPEQACLQGEVRQAHLLIVDDQEDDIEFAKRCLIRRPKLQCRVSQVRDGKEAYAFLTQEGDQPVDLILMDINMPGMNGFELLERIREDERLSSIRIIMCSGSDYAPDRLRARELGAVGYLVKPPSFEQFREVIDHVPSLALIQCEPDGWLLQVTLTPD